MWRRGIIRGRSDSLVGELGRAICEKQKKAAWGDGLMDQVARDLSGEFPGMKGFSARNFFYIKSKKIIGQGPC